MRPRFVNPHLVIQSTEYVSRATLDTQAVDSETEHTQSGADVNNGWMIMELEKLIRGTINPDSVAPPDTDMSSAEVLGPALESDKDARRKRKRRKLENGAEVADESVPKVSPGMSCPPMARSRRVADQHKHSGSSLTNYPQDPCSLLRSHHP